MYPPVLTIEVDAIGSRTWFGREKKIRWEDIAGLYYNTGNKQFSVRNNSGRKITHAGFNADGEMFRDEMHKRTLEISTNSRMAGYSETDIFMR